MNDPLILTEGIKKVFFTDEVETHALSEIHIKIEGGEYVSIAGPSGCGKSTLLSILGLLDTPTDERYVSNGKEVARLNFAERGVTEQVLALNEYLLSPFIEGGKALDVGDEPGQVRVEGGVEGAKKPSMIFVSGHSRERGLIARI